jgi:hypothetical protein
VQDALTANYDDLMGKVARNGVIDYLQLDCEPAKSTYDIMELIPFDKYKFAVITYEHDYFADATRLYRDKSRKFLESKGYKMAVNDISPDGISNFEDWWYHPDLVDEKAIPHMSLVNDKIKHVENDYMLAPSNYFKPTIVDYFLYFNEKELLDFRVNLLKDHVDKFVICEGSRTFSGAKKDFVCKQHIKELGLPEDMIEVIELELPSNEEISQVLPVDLIQSRAEVGDERTGAWVRERLQKDGIMTILDKFDDQTVFIVSECDEIINPDNIEFTTKFTRMMPDKIIKIPLVMLEGRADLRVHLKDGSVEPWDKMMFLAMKHHLQASTPLHIRCNFGLQHEIVYLTQSGRRMEDLGWHFTWMGDAERKKIKARAFSHFNDSWDGFVFKQFGSEEMDKFMDNYVAKEGEIAPSGHIDSELKLYDKSNLPQLIFSKPSFMKFFFGV